MIYGSAAFKFDGQSWRCKWVNPMPAFQRLGQIDFEMIPFPPIKTIYLRGMFKKLPKPGQFCSKPHRLLGA